MGILEVNQLTEEYTTVDLAEILKELNNWKSETHNETIYITIDTCIDIILNNLYK